MIKDVWQQKSDEEVITASEHLSQYTKETEEIIRTELRRRRMPEPEPTARTVGDEQSKQPRSFGLILIVVLMAVGIIGGIWLYLSQSTKIDASEIDDMVKSISVKTKECAEKGNLAGFEKYVFVMSGLGLEKALILTSPKERSQEALDFIYETIHRSDYDKTLREDLSATQYQALQRLLKEYKYVKD